MQGSGPGRASLDSLLAMTDPPGLRCILLDHQPYGSVGILPAHRSIFSCQAIPTTDRCGPLPIITYKMFELSHGYGKFGNTHVIVSSGFGIWGPRMRIGTQTRDRGR
ncbi:MAG: hypothetical protein MZV63_35505 [Marinilabiliales bacterium]|nr:hypothetical protein [Marinilabiliales bacterium]